MKYYAEKDTYYIQIRGVQYKRLDKKIKRLADSMERTQNKGSVQKQRQLAECRRRLLKEKRHAQCYVEIAESDLPENVRARPVYSLPGQVVTVGPERYAQLLERLQRHEEKDEES